MKLRFAPSPTGYLHVGNARIALANALTARRAGGHLLLRLDDTDRERSRPEYEDAIRQDLTWLGVAWDSEFRQMDRLPAYEEAADKLRASGRLYPCFESEDELRAKRELALKRGRAPIYDRAMLQLTPEQRANAEAGGKRPYWRFKLSPGEIRWNDLVLGTRSVKLGAVSDPVLIRADGSPLYTFTSVVDDIFSDITHIVRGEDHITNTGVQIDIFRALRDATGGPPLQIQFAHLPLLVDSDGGKLSKRLEGLSLRSLRQDGMEPAAITSYLARLGTSLSPEILPLDALAETFELSHVSRSSARFDMTQLLRLNRHVLQAATFDDVRSRLPPGATEAFWNAVRGNLDLLTEARHWWDVVAGDISPPPMPDDAAYLAQALTLLPDEPWTVETWSAWTKAVKAATGKMGKGLFMPLRQALTGETHGPELAALLPLMGRSRAEHRLRLAAL
jgi:glutamyl-tRNA synthetase